MHAVSRTQLIGPALYEHASRAVDHRNGFTELVDMIRQKRARLESRYAGAEAGCATCLGDEGLQLYAAACLICARIPLTRGNNLFPDHVRRFTHAATNSYQTIILI
jgi:hypothetical protein